MRRADHALPHASLGQQTTLTSMHFGAPDARPKAYIQASLHAEEIPAMLTAHWLHGLLEQAEREGRLCGQVVLVPVANPIGLAQRVDHKAMGRFELGTSENFNRHYPNLADAVAPALRGKLTADPQRNVDLVRAATAAWLDQWQPATPVQGLRKMLVSLAYDADLVLDLHCDCEAALHLYSEDACWPRVEPLARLLQARAVLLASDTGASSFDECVSGLWWQLAARLRADADPAMAGCPLPQACTSATVELRGEADVEYATAQADAQAILDFLVQVGVLGGSPPALPPAACQATPLAGSQTVRAPVAGIVVFRAAVGARLAVGDPVADIVDPLAGSTTTVRAEVDGVMYARTYDRFALPHDDLANIAGSIPFRTGNLLGA